MAHTRALSQRFNWKGAAPVGVVPRKTVDEGDLFLVGAGRPAPFLPEQVYWQPEFAASAGPIQTLSAELLIHILTYLTPRELAHVSSVCRALRFLPSDNHIWEGLCRSAYPEGATGRADAVAEDDHWKAEYKYRRDKIKHAQGYARAIMYGGKREPPPTRLLAPRYSYYERVADRECKAEATQLLAATGEASPPPKDVPSNRFAGASRQGTCKWSTLNPATTIGGESEAPDAPDDGDWSGCESGSDSDGSVDEVYTDEED